MCLVDTGELTRRILEDMRRDRQIQDETLREEIERYIEERGQYGR